MIDGNPGEVKCQNTRICINMRERSGHCNPLVDTISTRGLQCLVNKDKAIINKCLLLIKVWRLTQSIYRLENEWNLGAFSQHNSFLQPNKPNFLVQNFCFSFIVKPINSLWQSLGLYQVGATPFSPIYPFVST